MESRPKPRAALDPDIRTWGKKDVSQFLAKYGGEILEEKDNRHWDSVLRYDGANFGIPKDRIDAFRRKVEQLRTYGRKLVSEEYQEEDTDGSRVCKVCHRSGHTSRSVWCRGFAPRKYTDKRAPKKHTPDIPHKRAAKKHKPDTLQPVAGVSVTKLDIDTLLPPHEEESSDEDGPFVHKWLLHQFYSQYPRLHRAIASIGGWTSETDKYNIANLDISQCIGFLKRLLPLQGLRNEAINVLEIAWTKKLFEVDMTDEDAEAIKKAVNCALYTLDPCAYDPPKGEWVEREMMKRVNLQNCTTIVEKENDVIDLT